MCQISGKKQLSTSVWFVSGYEKIIFFFFFFKRWFCVCFSDNIKRLSVSTAGESVAETNFIGLINNYCQEKKIQHDYILENQCGPSHTPQSVWLMSNTREEQMVERSSTWLSVSVFNTFSHRFSYKLIIDKKRCYVGKGKSVKKAQQHAAQQAWSDLQDQSDWDNKVFSILLLVYFQTYGL